MKNKNQAMHVSIVTIITNIILSILKAFAGFFSNSSAMISDAIHSASDVISTLIVMVGIKASDKTADKKHPYGHERMECIASLLLSVALFLTGAGIGFDGIKNIITQAYINTEKIKNPALIAAAVSIGVKEWMFWYTRATAKRLNSTSLMADAWHHRSDALSSVGSLIGISLSLAGYPIFDPIASVIICVLILKVSIEIFNEAIKKMIDTAADEEIEKRLIETIKSVDGVIEVNKLRTRLFGAKMYVDVEFAADGNLSLTKAHEIAHTVHDLLEEKFPEIKHCMVHVNPKKKM